MKRQGNEYNDLSLSGQLSSATSIREHYKLNGSFEAIPEKAKEVYLSETFINANDISQMLHYKLLTTSSYDEYLDCSRDLSDRINNNLKDFVSYKQFCELIKTKNIEYSRVSRVLCHILLNITEEDFKNAKLNGYITSLRMLGFSKNGNSLLGQIKEKGEASLITSPDKELTLPSDIISSEIFKAILVEKTSTSYPNEYTRKFNLVNL